MSSARIIRRFLACEGSIELFILEGQPAVELLCSNPLAGFCLALNHIFHKPVIHWPLAAARDLMQKPQREILAWLGFKPATESVAKIGRKCLPEAMSLERCLHLRRVLAEDEAREMLVHLRRVNAGVIELIASRQLRAAVAPQLLHAVADSDEEAARADTATLLKDALRMRSILHRKDSLRPFHSRLRIVEEHDALVFELNSRGVTRFAYREFPPPPVAGYCKPGEQIAAVRNPAALQALGREQHNCVGSYEKRILSGSVYIYCVSVAKEVSTLSLVKDRHGCWAIDELKTSCNQPVSQLTRFVVNRWFEAAHGRRPSKPRRAALGNRPLAIAPLAGGASGGVQITAVPDLETLAVLLTSDTVADFLAQRARGGREHYYQAVAARGSHLVSIERSRTGYRLKEVRGAGGGAVGGDVLVAVSDWLGRSQRRYR